MSPSATLSGVETVPGLENVDPKRAEKVILQYHYDLKCFNSCVIAKF